MIKLARIYSQKFSSVKTVEKVPGYKLLSSDFSQDFNIQINEFLHQNTGAKVYHFDRNDEDNTFATIFKTFPSDSKGCPHILQHLACCGSHKYPIRDPFFNMLKRSVNSYMNAWTGEDFTCYPFSSANPKDWSNLFSVYTDMSFRPLLNELDFMQEGWRYQINEKGEKEIKGIVFNQMKGAYQSAERQLMMALNQGLFAGTGYVYDSGGKPQQIVNLTYNQLKDMYNYFYHPSNMSLFLYGNQNISQVLTRLDTQYLKNYTPTSKYNHNAIIKPLLPKENFRTIISKTAECSSISGFFYINNIENISPVQSLCFRILGYMMLEKNTALAYEKFIESGIAQNLGHSGFNQSKLATFGVTLKGINPQYDPKQFYQQLLGMLKQMGYKGISQKRMSEFLHQMQIGIKTPKENYGIKLLQDTVNYMNHRLPLINYLSPLKYVDQAKEILLDKNKLRGFIQKHFVENRHFVVVRQVSQAQTGQQSQEEQKKITSSIQIPQQQIKTKQQQLKHRQSIPQDANILPNLSLSDLIPRRRLSPTLVSSTKSHNTRHLTHYHIPIQNQINFYRIVFTFKNLDFNLNDRLLLWTSLLNKGISTKKHSYKQLTSLLGQFTAGFHTATSFGAGSEVHVVLGISCLKRNKDKLLGLVEEIIFESEFQHQNVLNLFRSFQNQAVQALTDTPIAECLDQCGSSINLKGRLFNKYQKIKAGFEVIRKDDVQSMRDLSQFLLSAENVTLIEHSNQKSSQLPSFFKRFQSFPTRQSSIRQFSPAFPSKAITHHFDVNFCSQQYPGPEYLSQQHAYLCILTQFLQQQHLHPQIRQKGGAYGARSSIRQSGNIGLYSYMDPQSTKTFNVFDQSVRKIKEIDTLPQDKLTEIKITLLGEMERIKVPQQECVSMILKNYDIKRYEQFLEWVKTADSTKIIETGRKFLDQDKKSRCIFGKEVPEGFTEEKLSSFI